MPLIRKLGALLLAGVVLLIAFYSTTLVMSLYWPLDDAPFYDEKWYDGSRDVGSAGTVGSRART